MLLRRSVAEHPGICPRLLLCVIFATVAASLPANHCSNINCAQLKRELCKPGSSHCGPCRSPFEENQEGQCVHLKHRQHEQTFSDLDDEIDFLSSIMANQPPSPDKHPASSGQVKPGGPEVDESPKGRAISLQEASGSNTSVTTNASVPVHPTPKAPQPHTQQGRNGPQDHRFPSRDTLLVIVISLCVIVGTLALIFASVFWMKYQRESRLARKVDYPAFGATEPVKMTPSNGTSHSGDNALAQSAQMYHYQHQKQQMRSMGKHLSPPKVSESGATSDEEYGDGGFTVYECPGLAPTGEMEVKNPLFDDSTPNPQRSHK